MMIVQAQNFEINAAIQAYCALQKSAEMRMGYMYPTEIYTTSQMNQYTAVGKQLEGR
jgi:hypothetical protein